MILFSMKESVLRFKLYLCCSGNLDPKVGSSQGEGSSGVECV